MDGLLIGQMEYIREKSQILYSVTETNYFTNISGLVPLKMMRCKKPITAFVLKRSRLMSYRL